MIVFDGNLEGFGAGAVSRGGDVPGLYGVRGEEEGLDCACKAAGR